MSERRMRLGIGLFVLVTLILLAVLVVIFGSLPTLFKRSDIYTIRFVDAPGVGPGTPVRRSGVRIGEVRDVILDDERGIVRVQVAIDPRYTLRHNEQPTLTVGLLGSDAAIDFVAIPAEEGQAVDRSPIAPGSEMVGVRPVSVNTLLNRASEVAPTAQETLNEIRRSLQRLERISPLAEDTLREYTGLAKDVRNAIPDLKRTNQEYQDLAKKANRIFPDLERTNKEYQDLAKNVNRIIPDLEQTNKEYQGLAKDVRKALPGAQQNLDDIGATARIYGKIGERLNLWAQANLDNVTKAIDNLNTVLTRVANVFNDENQRNLTAILKNTRVASERFDNISRNLDSILEDARPSSKQLSDTLNRANDVLVNLQRFSKPLGERGESITLNLAESLDKSNKALDDVLALFRALDKDGTIQRLLKDPSLYNSLDAAACQLARSVPRLDRILKDFETFADKLARHPELLGARGAIRPSTGLKEPPQPYNQPIMAPGP